MALIPDDLIHRVVITSLRLAQPEFFRCIRIEGTPLDDPAEHVLVVANHPYGIQDAFLLSFAYTRPFYFVATAKNFQRRDGDTIRKRPLRGWILSKCKVLPIVRDRSEGHMSDNLRTFATAADQMAGGHALGIFAEGDSRGNQWNLLKLKAGAAQLALQTADILRHKAATLKIQVVGLTYTNWDEPFKSSVTLRFAEPFAVARIDMTDKRAVKRARKSLTARMTELMEELTVQIADEHQRLAGKIAQFYSASYPDDYRRLKIIGRAVERLAPHHLDERAELEQTLDEYLGLAQELRLYPGEERAESNRLLLWLAALPACVGYWIHWPILWAARKAVPRQTTALHSLGSRRLGWSIAFTLGAYFLLGLCTLLWGAWKWGAWGVSLALSAVLLTACCGVTASRWYRRVNLMLRSRLPSRRRFKRYRELGADLLERLERYRREAEQQAVADQRVASGPERAT